VLRLYPGPWTAKIEPAARLLAVSSRIGGACTARHKSRRLVAGRTAKDSTIGGNQRHRPLLCVLVPTRRRIPRTIR
jgi:hypothetical protein